MPTGSRSGASMQRIRSTGPSAMPGARLNVNFPSQYEVFSLVTFEAAAEGLPVLVTPVSGPTDLIKQGENVYFLNDH